MQSALGTPGGGIRPPKDSAKRVREFSMLLGKLGLQASRKMVMVTATVSVSSERRLQFLSLSLTTCPTYKNIPGQWPLLP